MKSAKKDNLKIYLCEKCDVAVFKERKPLEVGMNINSDIVESLQGHKEGDKLECKLCGAKLYLHEPSRWVSE